MADNHRGKNDKQVSRILMAAMQYSSSYNEAYVALTPKLKNFRQMEQMYLCMAAGVPPEQVQQVLETEEPGRYEEAMQALWYHEDSTDSLEAAFGRMKKIEQEQKYFHDFLEAVERKEQELWDHMKQMENGQKEEKVQTVPAEGNGLQSDMRIQMETGQMQSALKKLERKQKELGYELEYLKKEGTQVRGIVIESPAKLPWRRKRKQKKEREEIERLLSESYDAEQVDYLLECRMEGVPWEKIHQFSNQKFPVDLMRKLRSYYEEKEKADKQKGTKYGK